MIGGTRPILCVDKAKRVVPTFVPTIRIGGKIMKLNENILYIKRGRYSLKSNYLYTLGTTNFLISNHL